MRRKAEGDEMEPPKPKKKSSGPKFNDDTGYNFDGTPSLTVTLLISAREHMKDVTDCAKWHLPAIGTTVLWSLHQADSSVIPGHIGNMSSELEVAGIERSVYNFIDKSLHCLGAGGKVTPDALANGLPPIFFLYLI